MQRKRTDQYIGWWVALLIIFGLAAWRVIAIETTHMRPDEEIAFRTTSGDLAATIAYQAQQDIQAPLWFAAFWGWQQLVGTHEVTARIFSILITLITLALVYRVGARWFGARRAGIFALIALGVSTYFFIYSLEIRPYALVLLLAAAAMWAFERWLRLQTWRAALLYGLTLVLLAYTHYFLVFLVLAQILYVIARVRPLDVRRIGQGVAAVALAGILWLPWVPVFVSQLAVLRDLAQAAGAAQQIGTASTAQPTSPETVHALITISTNGHWLLVALIAISGLGMTRRMPSRWRANLWLALSWAVGVPLIALLINTVAAVYSQRYVVYLSVGLALLIGAVTAALPGRWRLLALTIFVALSLAGFADQLPVRTPYRDIYTALSAAGAPGDVIYLSRAGENDNHARWQMNAYLAPGFEIIADHDLAAAESARRVWYLTGDWFATSVRETFAQLEVTHPVQQVIGQCDRDWCYLAQLMEAPPLADPLIFGGALPFWGVDVDAVTEAAVDVRLWWRVDHAPLVDYAIGLQLLAADGRLVAQTDGPIRHYGTQIVETSQMTPGRIYIDHRRLALPPDLAAGAYALALTVYQWWDGEVLTLVDGSERLRLDTLTRP
ncbi:MAG: hypothetical protein GYB67_06770 [Chloroflexi bacterium]|nr:hypothetical protein [Chloroflexota bacterium]